MEVLCFALPAGFKTPMPADFAKDVDENLQLDQSSRLSP